MISIPYGLSLCFYSFHSLLSPVSNSISSPSFPLSLSFDHSLSLFIYFDYSARSLLPLSPCRSFSPITLAATWSPSISVNLSWTLSQNSCETNGTVCAFHFPATFYSSACLHGFLIKAWLRATYLISFTVRRVILYS